MSELSAQWKVLPGYFRRQIDAESMAALWNKRGDGFLYEAVENACLGYDNIRYKPIVRKHAVRRRKQT